MASSTLHDVLQHMRCVWAAKASRDFTDSQLLERFLGDQDETAFGVLMQRHGPLVLGVCRRLTGDSHLAEDSFQGTFMVLARRAASIRKKASLASWLYGVAQHIATRAKAQATARRVRERRLTEMPDARPLDELTSHELQNTLDAEIGSLPEKYRAPLVLCYLEGKTHDAAALELRWPKTTLTNRLSRGRELLRKRLIRRGFTLSAGALVSALSTQLASAAITARLTLNTVRAAMNVASGASLAAAGLSARAIVLAQEGMKATVGFGGKVVALIVMISVTVGGAGLAGYGGWQERAVEKPTKPKGALVLQVPPKNDVAQKKDTPAVDIYGDPLPEGAMARLGTTRFRAGTMTSAMAFSPDDKILVAILGQMSGGLKIWDAKTGQIIQQIAQSKWERYFAISPDGKRVFLGQAQNDECTLRLLDTTTGNVTYHFDRSGKDTKLPVSAMEFSPDGKTVAAGGGGNQSLIILWDVESGKQLGQLSGDSDDHVWVMRYSPDGKLIATAGTGKVICLWDVATGKIIRRLDEYKLNPPPKVKEPGVNNGRITFLSFSSDGKFLASLGEDSITRLWDVESGKVLHRLEGDLATMCAMAFSKDGKIVATGGRNGSIYLWDVTTGRQKQTWLAHPHDINNLVFSHDDKTLASSGQGDAAIKRWDVTTGSQIDTDVGHTSIGKFLRFAPDGKGLLSGARDCKVIEWDLTTLKDTGRLFGRPMGPAKDGWQLDQMDLAPDGKTCAVVGAWWTDRMSEADATIRFFDVNSGKETGFWKLDEKEFLAHLKYSPSGKYLVTTCRKGGIKLWDVSAGKVLKEFEPSNFNSVTAAWSPDGKLLALTESKSNTGRTIIVWDIGADKELRRWDSGQWHVQELCFTPDGKSIVSASTPSSGKDSTDIRVWSADTGALLRSFAELEEDSTPSDTRITAMGITPNGRVLAVGVFRETRKPNDRIYNCKVHLFDMLSLQEIRRFDAPQGTIHSLAFGVDGRTLATGGADSSILLWDLGAYVSAGPSKFATSNAKLLEECWSGLAGDAPKADGAMWALVAAPKISTPLLKDRMLIAAATPAEVAKLIASLSSDSFTEREKASLALEKLADTAEVAVRKHLEGNITLEVRQRLQQFLSNRDKDAIRKLRAIEVLEIIGTAESRQLLETLAKEAPNPRVLEGAAGALARLTKRGM